MSVTAHHKMAKMKGQVVLKSNGILIMLLRHVTMEILINKAAAILNCLRFGGERLVKGF